MVLITNGVLPEIDYEEYYDVMDYPHLYDSVNSDFTSMGTILSDALTCQVTWNRNQFPTLQMTYPRDGKNALKLEVNKYIVEDINRKFVHQKFKIIQIQKEFDNFVVDAEHISATLNDSTVPTNIQFVNGSPTDLMNQVFNSMQPGRDYTFYSEVDTVQNINITAGQQAGALLIDPDQEGDSATQSLLGAYGGELEFDNTDIHHSKHAGKDIKIIIDYGKNLQSASMDKNIESMYTGAVFTATYTPGQAIADEKNVDWNNWSTTFSNVAVTYLAGGKISIYDSPVEGQNVVRTLSNGEKLHLGVAVTDQSFTPDKKFQINTVNGDSWYPISPDDGGGWIDANWLNFDTTGSYLVSNITGKITVKSADPHDESGAGTRVSMSGYAVVSYEPGKSINGYYSPDIGPKHYRNRKTYKNGTRIHYDMVERNQNGDLWYRIGDHNWLYGPHLALDQEGSYSSFTNYGYGEIKDKSATYHLDKNGKMTATTKIVAVNSKSKKATKKVGRGKNKKTVLNGAFYSMKKKKVKVTAKKGMATIDKTIVQGGTTYHHTQYGWVKSSSISFKADGSVKAKTSDDILKDKLKDNSKVEIYATPDKTNALNWSIPNGETFTIDKGHEAKGGDGKTYIQVTYKGKTGWLPEDNIDSDKSQLNAPEDTADSDSDTASTNYANVDQSQKEVKVVVGPLYAEGYGVDPNVDKVNTVDVSSYFSHDDQDLSGQQSDGSFIATEADIQQVTEIGQNYLKEHRYGKPTVSLTVSYQEMSGINADFNQLSLYDYVFVNFEKLGIQEQAEVNGTVWDCLTHEFTSLTIGELPETYEHLLLQAADKKSNERVSQATNQANGQMKGLLNRWDYSLKQEGASRKQAEKKLMEDLGATNTVVGKNGKNIENMLITQKNFESRMDSISNTADSLKNWVTSGGSGVITAYPNWQQPTYLAASTGNGGSMRFSGNGLIFYDENGNQRLRSGIDSEGMIYADSIKAGTIESVTINTCLVNGSLHTGDPNGMNVYIGTQKPGETIIAPDNGGNAIWVTSPSYATMVSSGQVQVTNGGDDAQGTQIHPDHITIQGAEVLTAGNWRDILGISSSEHLISSGGIDTNLTDFIKRHFDSKYYHGL